MDFSIWNFLAGVAIVLFGMEVLENSIHELSGVTLKRWLKRVANTPFKAIMSAFGITSILQSSSVVTLMILAFVGAGLLTLPNAIGAIIGANVGSTMLGILVVYIGFSFKISAFSLGMIAVGGLINKFLFSRDRKNVGKIILSFGFLFYGIGILRDAVEVFSNSLDFTQFSNIGLFGWFMIGIVFTAILHSSGAMTIITLGALHGGLVDFPQSMMIIAGSNIGTCITAIWGAMKGTPIKKQVAASHVIFNLVSGILVFFFAQPIAVLFEKWYDFSKPGAEETALAVFQLVYNIAGAILFYPFINQLAKFLQKIFHREKSDYILGVKGLELTDIDIAIPVVRNDIIMLFKKIFKFNVHHLRIDQKALLKNDISFDTKLQLEYVLSHDRLAEDYHIMKVIEEELLTFILKALNQPNLSKDNIEKLHLQSNAVERLLYASKSWQDTQHNINNLYQSDNDFIKGRIVEIKKNMITLYTNIIPIINEEDINKNYDSIIHIAHEIRINNKKLIDEVSEYLSTNTLENGLLSGLFHVIKAFERSNDAILDGIKYIFLDAEQRKYAN